MGLVKLSESCRLEAYQDDVGVWTIGWGCTGAGIGPGVAWEQQYADDQLMAKINEAAEGVLRFVKVQLTQGQFDALVDFTYNMGVGKLAGSTLLKLLNSGQYDRVPSELYHKDDDGTEHGWIYAGGRILPGLVTRRKREIVLWNGQNPLDSVAA